MPGLSPIDRSRYVTGRRAEPIQLGVRRLTVPASGVEGRGLMGDHSGALAGEGGGSAEGDGVPVARR
jgi:hypothetical protein